MENKLNNWENGRWIGQTLEVENGVCALPANKEYKLDYNDDVKLATDHLYAGVARICSFGARNKYLKKR
jgi:quinolinate synthase